MSPRQGGTEARPRPDAGRRRRAARLAAVQALYQIELNDGDAEDVILEIITHRSGATLEDEDTLETDVNHFADLVRGASRQRVQIDTMLSEALAVGWRLERLEAVLGAILRCAVYELLMRPDIPAKVTITEYVNVTQTFFSGKQSSFANAVLDRIAHNLRRGGLGGRSDERPAETG